ncbi:aminotransferase class IV [Salinicoccus sp. CNSTN-B1]
MQAKIHNDAIDSPAEFLSNKTSIRHHYEGVSNEFPLVLYYNKRHQITEFNLGNLVVMEKDGYFTPSVDTGLLEGVMRTSLISDGVISERDYDLDEFIRRYEQGEIEVYMINSLREWVEVNLDVQR